MGRLDEPASGEAVVLPVGSEEQMRSHTVAFMHAGTSTANGTFFSSRAATVAGRAEAGQEDRPDRAASWRIATGSTSGGPESGRVGPQRSVEERQARETAAEQSRAGARPDPVLRTIHRARVRPAVQIPQALADHALC